jgi:predicted nucleic acid-binding protein
VNRVLVDTGFLVALGIARDKRHRAACEFLDDYTGELLVPAPVVAETCYFLSTTGKVRLLDWLRGPQCKVLDLPAVAYGDVGDILTRYTALDPDFTDAALVWFAQETQCHAILTVDVRDFGVFRVGRGASKGRRFELVKWL